MRPIEATCRRSSSGSLCALVAPRELARQRQEALDELIARVRVTVVVIAHEQGAILPGTLGAASRPRVSYRCRHRLILTHLVAIPGLRLRSICRTFGRTRQPPTKTCAGGWGAG